MSFSLSSTVLSGEIEGEAGMTLEDALKIAYTHNPRMQTAGKETEAAKGRRITQSAFIGPEVSFEIGGFKSQTQNGEKVHPDKNLDSFEIVQPFDPPGVRFLRSRIAGTNVKIAQGDFLLAWTEVSREVKSAFRGLLYAQEAIKVFRSNLDAARQFLDRVETKFQAGNALKSERIRARIETLRAEEEVLEAEKELQNEKARLNLLLGQSSEAPIEIKGELSRENIEIRHKQFMARALSKRVDLLNQRLRFDASKKAHLKSKLSSLPQPFVGFERTNEDYEDDYSVLLGAKFPTWDFNLGEIKETTALKEKEKIALNALEREVVSQVDLAIREVEISGRKYEIEKRALDEANELLREATLQYTEGKLGFIAYLENLRVIKQTRLSYFTAVRNHSEKIAELERAIQAVPIPEEKK